MNKTLKRSRSKKNDEFYTELTDIELELPIHANSFNGLQRNPRTCRLRNMEDNISKRLLAERDFR